MAAASRLTLCRSRPRSYPLGSRPPRAEPPCPLNLSEEDLGPAQGDNQRVGRFPAPIRKHVLRAVASMKAGR